MTIEIHEPKVEALIRQWMESGRFRSIEEAIGTALDSTPIPDTPRDEPHLLTGADIFAALQRCPHPEVDLEPERYAMPVREFTW